MTTKQQRDILERIYPGCRESLTAASRYHIASHRTRRPDHVFSDTTRHLTFVTPIHLSFEDVTGILANYCVYNDQPLPANKYQILDICQAYIYKHGSFQGIDYDVINISTLYKARCTVAKCMPDFFPLFNIPQWVVLPPKGFSEEDVQCKPPVLDEHMIPCQEFSRGYSHSKYQQWGCGNLSDYKTTRAKDGITMYLCEGHYRLLKAQGRYNEGKRISEDVTMVTSNLGPRKVIDYKTNNRGRKPGSKNKPKVTG